LFFQIPSQLQTLCDDVRFWLDHHTFTEKEIAVRFHHRLVYIHPFPNGNGRHGRLATDALLVSLKKERFTWGRISLIEPSQTRGRYIQALRDADQGYFENLLSFVES
jgi:Fic-DOC domain mobile mystery protein B